jgi:hypothetical protein
LSLLKRNPGVCASSQWRTLMATPSTSTVTEQAPYNMAMEPTIAACWSCFHRKVMFAPLAAHRPAVICAEEEAPNVEVV